MSRLRGQSVSLDVLAGGVPQASINAIKSAEMEFMVENKQEGFLGETSDRFDDIFNGISGKMTFQIDTPDVFVAILAIINRARRRTSGITFNIKMTFNFDNGRRYRIVIQDVAFGAIPVKVGGRTDYVELSLDYKASNFQPLAA